MGGVEVGAAVCSFVGSFVGFFVGFFVVGVLKEGNVGVVGCR